ncbi:MAG: DUF2779 domain-containing protein [Erysipelotrichaceae bacterium]|nr:DUF2779 domain-containing protein [Erysipelotrichaceae bacterium]
MYHISDIKKFLRCERLYIYGRDEANVFRPYLRNDENITDRLKEYFNINECFEGVRNDQPSQFIDNYEKYEWFIHPRFCDGELRINVPLVHKNEGKLDLYYIFYSNAIRELDTLTYKVGYQVINKSGYEVNDIYVIYLESDYVNEGKLDVKKLFVITNEYKRKKIIDIVKNNDFDYQETIRKMEEFKLEDSVPKKNRFCKLYGLCEFYDRCFPDEIEKDDDSILTLVTSQNKNKMYDEGIRYLKDADPEQIEGNRMQYAQIMASKNGGLFLDKLALRNWFEQLEKRPISFIDFEWDRYLIPEYEKMKPMDVVCFEFALYYIDEDGHMEHRTFVGNGDCRREFVEALIDYLPASGPILAYNALGAECLRLKELSEIYPEYKEKLNAIIDRFVDLAFPFLEGLVYDVRMAGDYTLKKLVDICSDYSYKDLDIYDGMEAVFNWRNMDRADEETRKQILDNLEEYCSLDAYGLFLVYRWLIKLMVESK